MPESLQQRRSALRALLLLGVGLLLSGALGLRQSQSNAAQLRDELDALAQGVADDVTGRVRLFEYGLRGVRGAVLAAGGEAITRRQFRLYADSRDVDIEFPGARGFGFIRRVVAQDESAFLAAARSEGPPDFTIHGLGPPQATRYVIQYIEPVQRNLAAVGLDIATEPQRRAAAERAARSDAATLTGPITLVQATGRPLHAFLILLPVYRSGSTPEGPQAREAATFGWAYTPLVMDEVLAGPLPRHAEYTLRLHDITEPGAPQRFFGPPSPPAGADSGRAAATDPTLTRRLQREVFGRQWQIELRAEPAFVARLQQLRPEVVFGLGALTSLLLAALLYAHLVDRGRIRLIRAHRARMATLIENSSDAIVTESRDGRLTGWNRAAERIFGLTAAEALGRHATTLLLPLDRRGGDQVSRERALLGETVPPYDEVLLRRDGSEIEVSQTLAPISAPDGSIVGIGRTIRDIGEHKLAERRLQAFNAELERQVAARTRELATAHRDLQTLLDAVPSMIGYWDRHLVNRFANRAYQDWFGRRGSSLAGRHMQEVLGPQLFELNRPHIEAVLRGEARTFERSIPRPGQHGWRHALAHYLPDRVDGEVQGFYVLVHDVTELTESRQRLAESEAFLERAGRLAGVGGWRLDLATDRLTWTRETFTLHGLPPGEPPSPQQALAFYAPQARATLQEAMRLAIEQGRGWDLELPLTTAQGRAIWVRTIGEPEYEELPPAPPAGLVGAIQDVTARREALAALEARRVAEAANEAKSAFLATMSHEMRTPLNALIGLSHLLEGTRLDAEQRDFLTKMQLAGRSLLGVINAVLDLAKIEAGEMALEQLPFDLHALLDELIGLLGPQARAKGLDLSLQRDPALPVWVRGDAGRLRQVLVNLLGNAIKFTEQGRVELLAAPDGADADGHARLRLAVRDTGIGIDAQDQARLFEPFVQADASTSRRFGGTGLGLSIVRHLVQMMGGEVGVHSRLGEGSEFWLSVPLQALPAHAVPAQPAGAAPAAASVTLPEAPPSLAVVIGLDDPRTGQALAETARRLGWQVEALPGGDAAVALWLTRTAAGTPLDVLLLGWPAHQGRTGPPALARLCEPEEGRRRPALVACSEDPGLAAEALGAGVVDAVLHLPADPGALFNAVSQALAAREGGAARVLQATRLEAGSGGWLDGLRVQVVDDSEINREVAERLLAREGAQVQTCASGQEALDRLRARPGLCDAVLMDVQMPGLDGLETTRRLRAELGLTRLPVIALSAGAMTDERQRALDSGMDDFIGKPLDPRTLIVCLRQRVERSRHALLPLPSGEATTETGAPSAAALAAPAGAEGGRRAAVPQPALPAIDGIDAEDLASRLGHDRALFASLLARVLREFAPLAQPPVLPAPGEARRPLLAQLHKLRGSSGMLGARALAQAAGAAEDALRDAAAPADCEARLQDLAEAFSRLRRASADFLAREGQDDDADDDTAAGRSAPDPARLAELAELLRRQDLAALDHFQALAPALRATWGAERFRRARLAVDELQFPAALAVLEEAAPPR
ncbi:MAG: CHASE domain-containing protein [Burkholderiaceae bacterium]|nr:CHASE domain-containing protein [Burkholderiaceae bacterium]